MNRLYKYGAAVILMMVMSVGTFAQDNFCGIHNNSFKSGEVALFKVYYNMGWLWAGAGTATFTTNLEQYGGKPVYHVKGVGKTYSSYEWFYKVHDVYESFIDTSNMMPVKFKRDVSEGDTKFKNYIDFNHDSQKATTKNGTYDIPNCVQDVLSTIYYARSIDYSKYKPGDKIPFSMFIDDAVYNLYIRYVGKERVKTKYGVFDAIKIAPLLVDGTMFKGGEKMMVWVSDDKNHIPVRIDSPILIGSIKVDLIGYKNLKHPFTSLIKKR